MKPQRKPQESAQPQPISVLLVEDALGDASAIMRAMVYDESLYTFNVTWKSSLKDGLHFLDDQPADVLLLDLNLPDAKELKAVSELHGLYPEMPIVVISGYSDMDLVHQALRSGAQEFLIKGECSGAAIRQSIYQAIARKKIEKSYEQGDRL